MTSRGECTYCARELTNTGELTATLCVEEFHPIRQQWERRTLRVDACSKQCFEKSVIGFLSDVGCITDGQDW